MRTPACALAIAFVLICCIGTGGCTAAGVAPDGAAVPVERLLSLMKRRLELAQDVARDKWNRGAPIEDATREQAVIGVAAAQAIQRGIDPQRVRQFFRGQIEAGKLIQAALFAQWRAERRGRFTDAPDLAAQIRPELDRLTAALVPALGDALASFDQPGASRALTPRTSDIAGFDAAWRRALEPLQPAR